MDILIKSLVADLGEGEQEYQKLLDTNAALMSELEEAKQEHQKLMETYSEIMSEIEEAKTEKLEVLKDIHNFSVMKSNLSSYYQELRDENEMLLEELVDEKIKYRNSKKRKNTDENCSPRKKKALNKRYYI